MDRTSQLKQLPKTLESTKYLSPVRDRDEAGEDTMATREVVGGSGGENEGLDDDF